MEITHSRLRQLFADFWLVKNHKEVPPAPLVLQEDPTTLFTSSGMQPLVPYLLGEAHPLGKRLYNIQPSIRTQDIDEVGDNRHTTFFEMMGNWSLNDYFKEEQLKWCFDFYVNILGLPKDNLYVTVFEGNHQIPKDTESATIWQELGIANDHIFYYGTGENWWSRSGPPDKMPPGEIGGPDSELFYDFGIPHKAEYGESCHPNCQCGRFLEIGNSVFMQYKKMPDGSLEELPQKNVDFGGGLERVLAAINNDNDVFKTDVFSKIIKTIEDVSAKSYNDLSNQAPMRIIADHLKASVFLISNGVRPSNKEQGYVLRRLLRRATIKLNTLQNKINEQDVMAIAQSVLETYSNMYFNNSSSKLVDNEIRPEILRFTLSLDRGLKETKKYDVITGKIAFNLYQSFGFPLEITEELAKEKGQSINHDEFKLEFDKHKELSRSASSGMFKGGLADQSEQTIKYHTATHLLHQALFDVLGKDVRQEGSNVTADRLRFDFRASKKPTEDEISQIEQIINDKIQEQLPVTFQILPKEEALKLGAKSFFKEKYPDMVKVYSIGSYSMEFCGGPHVKNTKEIGKISIYKVEKIGSNIYRIYAK